MSEQIRMGIIGISDGNGHLIHGQQYATVMMNKR